MNHGTANADSLLLRQVGIPTPRTARGSAAEKVRESSPPGIGNKGGESGRDSREQGRQEVHLEGSRGSDKEADSLELR